MESTTNTNSILTNEIVNTQKKKYIYIYIKLMTQFLLPISGSAATQFSLPISASTATQFFFLKK